MASNNPNDNRGNLGNDRNRDDNRKQLVSRLAQKFNCSESEVERAIQQVGDDREKIAEFLRNKRG